MNIRQRQNAPIFGVIPLIEREKNIHTPHRVEINMRLKVSVAVKLAVVIVAMVRMRMCSDTEAG